MTRIAKLTSLLLHPLLMPFYAMVVLLFATLPGVFLSLKSKMILLSVVFFFTFFTPLLFVALLVRYGRVSSFSMREQSERFIPLLFGAVMCYMTYRVLGNIIQIEVVLSELFLALSFFILLLAIITRFWKISLHMSAIGGMSVLIFMASYNALLLPFIILLSGLLGTSRLWLKAHDSAQVYLGFCLGTSYFFIYFLL